jgi:hypothetical protein
MLSILLVGACGLLFPTRLLEAEAGPSLADAGTLDALCLPALPPGAPAPTPATDASETTIYAALSSLTFGQTAPDGNPLGYDLDGVCTCPGPPSCSSTSRNCDEPGGRDVAGNVFLSQIDGYLGSAGGTLAERIASGKMTTILWLTSYNGGRDDSLVGLSLISSPGLDAPDGGKPGWNGHDVWNVDVRSVGGYVADADGGFSYVAMSTASGYVTGGVLVATVPSFELGAGVGRLTVNDAVFTATITAVAGGGYTLEGQVAGRVAAGALFGLLGSVPDPAHDGQYLCGTNATFQTLRTAVCDGEDIMSDPALDSTAAAVCDAVSFAASFTAVSAGLGAPVTASYPDPGCDGGVQACD